MEALPAATFHDLTCQTSRERKASGGNAVKPTISSSMQPEFSDIGHRSRLSRRAFIASALAAGVALPAAEMLWSNGAKAEPKKGGAFRAGIHDGSTTDTLDPSLAVSFFSV